MLAIATIDRLERQGLRVPEDVSVVGYDNVSDATYAIPPLTTVNFDKRLFADTALSLLMKRIDDNDRAISSVTIPYSIVQRSSTREAG
jgi:LacI family repressor for deo operon, udp, cdd, tsx, nupC, and nupG